MVPGAQEHLAPRALVTGAAGFIGAALTGELLARGWQVTGLDDLSAGRRERLAPHARLSFVQADVRDTQRLEEVWRAARPTCVFHLAACVGVRRVLADPAGSRAANLQGAASVARALERGAADARGALGPPGTPGAPPRFFFASTSEVYAERAGPLDERAALRAPATTGRFAYADSKRGGEELFDALASRVAGLAPVHLRFFNVVGPGQDAGAGMVLPRFVELAAAGRALPVYGDGQQVRTFAHVADVAAVLARLAERPELPAGALNVGGSARATLQELAQCVLAVSGSAAGVEHVDPRRAVDPAFEDVRWREPDLARLAGLIGSVPQRALRAIVADTWARHAAERAPWRPVCASLAS